MGHLWWYLCKQCAGRARARPDSVEVVIDEDFAGQLMNGPRGRRLLSALVGETVAATDDEPWVLPAWHHDDPEPLGQRLLEQLRQRLGRAVAAVDLDSVAARGDPWELLPALADAVGSARYWQHPDSEDQALSDPAVAEQLHPVAQAVAGSGAAAWWTQPVDLGTQLHLSWLFEGRDRYEPIATAGLGAVTSRAAAALRGWREEAAADEERCRVERPRSVGANWGGTWWSSPPQLSELLLSTPVLPATGGVRPGIDRVAGREVDGGRWGLPVGMSLVEDDLGVEEVHARAVRLRPGVRVFEVHRAQDWCDLVASHPRSVTFSRRHDWWRATGWEGAWALPDWSSVAREWDGVHLSVAGYLTVSGRLLQTTVSGTLVGQDVEGIAPGVARTLLAGWSPGQTYWLTDVMEEVGDPVPWSSSGDDYPWCWTPGSGAITTTGQGSG